MANGKSKYVQEAVQTGKLAQIVLAGKETASNGATPEWVDWGEVDGRLLAGAIVATNKHGGSLLFGHTRDKRSYSIMLFYGNDKKPFYFSCTPDGLQALEAFLYGLIDLDNDAP